MIKYCFRAILNGPQGSNNNDKGFQPPRLCRLWSVHSWMTWVEQGESDDMFGLCLQSIEAQSLDQGNHL